MDHPLRPIKAAVDAILLEMSPIFEAAYAKTGRPSVLPKMLLLALLLQRLYTVRSERALVERIDTDLLFRWFCGLDPAEPVFDATAFTHNRSRLDEHGITASFFDAVVKRAVDAGLTSDEHFSVDGTLIESDASIESFTPIEQQNHNKYDNHQLIAARQRMAKRMSDAGYALSQRARKKIEEGLGWCKTIGGLAPAHRPLEDRSAIRTRRLGLQPRADATSSLPDHHAMQ